MVAAILPLAAGPETVGAMIAELVPVAAGMLPPLARYFDAVRNAFDSCGIQARGEHVGVAERSASHRGCLTSAERLSNACPLISAVLMSDEFHDRI